MDLVHKLQARLVCVPEGITFKLPIENVPKIMMVTGQEKINNIPQELKGILTSLSA